MRTTAYACRILGAILACLTAGVACATSETEKIKTVPVGPNVAVEIQGQSRRVIINAAVCLREGQLEHLMCRKDTKEHEAILDADIDARDIHKALLVTGAKPGLPVQFEPKFQPPTGTAIHIKLQYQSKGKTITVDARDWVRNVNTKKALDQNWVFAGSIFYPDPSDPEKAPPLYAANGGDVICVSNFAGAMLDLPIASSNDDSELVFQAWSDRIPEIGTPVRMILEPIRGGK
jgi:hypothetical protein